MIPAAEQRMAYAERNWDRYTTWAGEVGNSPYSRAELLEWAILTAHTPFAASTQGFLATRGVDGIQQLADALNTAAVINPRNKAAYITQLRGMVADGLALPAADYRDYRRKVKLPGLGFCKLSFGACLGDPFGSDIICLDVHMGREYQPTIPIARIWSNLTLYERVEAEVLDEARHIGMPAFPYQWSTWCYTRLKHTGRAPDDHSFLWRSGKTKYQLPLFSGLAV